VVADDAGGIDVEIPGHASGGGLMAENDFGGGGPADVAETNKQDTAVFAGGAHAFLIR
jgi:hypothetical protein